MEEHYEHKLCHTSGPRTGGGYVSSQTLQICSDMGGHKKQTAPEQNVEPTSGLPDFCIRLHSFKTLLQVNK